MRFKFLDCCLIGLLIVSAASGQSPQRPPEKAPVLLDPADEQQVQKLVQEFTRRLQQTRDVSPLIDEMFVKDFKKLLTEDGWWAGLIDLPFPLAKQLDEGERFRLYKTQFSLEYLMKLYYAGKVPLTGEGRKNSTVVPPAKVVEYVKSSNPPTGEITTHEEALRLLQMLENTLKLMREEMASSPPEESELFKKNSAVFSLHLQEPDNSWGRPFVTTIARKFVHYPVGTRIVKLEIPFHNALMLVKENGQYKILFALINLPPD